MQKSGINFLFDDSYDSSWETIRCKIFTDLTKFQMSMNEYLNFAFILCIVPQIDVRKNFKNGYLIDSILKLDKFYNWWALILYYGRRHEEIFPAILDFGILFALNCSQVDMFRIDICFTIVSWNEKKKMCESKNFLIPNHGSDNEKESTKDLVGKKRLWQHIKNVSTFSIPSR